MKTNLRKLHREGLCRPLWLLFVALWLAMGGYAQPTGGGNPDTDIRNRRITLRASGESLGTILTKVAREANVTLIYKTSLAGIDEITTVNFEDEALHDVLSRLLASQGVTLRYDINNSVYVERPVQKAPSSNVKLTVSGTVISARDREPLIGATVIVLDNKGQGSRNGTLTDLNGKFSIQVPYKASVQISFVGFEKHSMQVTGDMRDIEIALQAGTDIDEVIVTGMGKKNRTSFTGGYVSVKGDELKRVSPTNLLKGLQFFDPSFRVVENNLTGSDPNAPMEFQIRGDQALGGSGTPNTMELLLDNVSSRPNMPLFVLDGFIVSINRVLELDPERVESITILKDAAATSIYGSRAANGVVVVETKVAPDGKLQISYAGNLTVQTPDLSDYNLCNAAEKLQLEWMAGVYDQNSASSMNQYNRYLRNVLAGVDSYWLSQPVRTAVQHRHSLSAAGGTEVFRYSLGLNVGFTPGVMKESSQKNKSVAFQMTYRHKKWIVGANITLADTRGDNSPYGSFSQYTQTNPYYPIYNEQGTYDRVLDNKGIGAGLNVQPIPNPLYNTMFKSVDFTKNLNLNNSLNIEFAPMDNLRFTAQLNYIRGIASQEKFLPPQHTDFVNTTDITRRGKYTKNTGETATWSTNIGVTYNYQRERHMINLFANWTVDESKSNYVNLSAVGYPNENMNDFIFGNDMDTNPTGSESTTRSMGFTGQVSYSYDNRYSAEFNVRGDISSQFGADNRMAPFWSAGIRWNAHREKWLEGRVSNLTLRATYGVTGSQSYDPYQAIEFYTFNMRPYAGSSVLGATLRALGNRDLGWSKADNFSAEVALGVWKNRLNLTFNYYNTITRQMLVDYNLAPSTGFTTQTINAGELQNRGFDASLNIIALQDVKRELYWTIGLNGNHNKNRIRKISNGLQAMNEQALSSRFTNAQIYQEGNSTTTLYMVRSLGIDPTTGKEVFLTRDGKRTFTWNPADKVAVGDTAPDLSGSIYTSLNWRDFNFSMAFSYTLGGDVYNSTLVNKIENRNVAYNADRRALTDRWMKPGDVTQFKGFDREGSNSPESTRFLMTENRLTLGSLAIGYRLRDEKIPFLRKLNISVINLTFTTNELFHLSTIRQERGLDYPFARSYNLALSILFK